MLLNLLTKRLCPLMSLAALALGCGKKINEAESGPGNINQPIVPSDIVVIELDTDLAQKKTYTLVYDATFYIPRTLMLKEGDASGQKVRISYNIDSSGKVDYFCDYVASSSANELTLDFCVDHEGITFLTAADNFEARPFSQDKGHRIEMEIFSTDRGLIIDALYTAKWYPDY